MSYLLCYIFIINLYCTHVSIILYLYLFVALEIASVTKKVSLVFETICPWVLSSRQTYHIYIYI